MRRAIIGWIVGTVIVEVIVVVISLDAPKDIVKELGESGFFFILGVAGGAIGTLTGLATNRVRR